ncbi:hypothetical protein [Legionella rowbothamii]|uniref:hypothetical protein n=1 Tax=Legionella rowbothamii TaxID=96229 RepID=UPI0010565B41|nr:hypothetical protein [Legionella rowbothamii]
MSSVNILISSAFEMAFKHSPEIHQKWIKSSLFTGAQLPNTQLVISLQDIGNMDLLLRAMEDESSSKAPLNLTYQRLLSDLWIGSCYEVFRVMKQKIKPESETFKKIFKNLTLIRIGIEKHEIAGDKKLKEPIAFVCESSIEQYEYNPTDEKRGHIMKSGLSKKGSIVWEVLDIKPSPHNYWLERRDISDDVVNYLAENDYS